MNDQENQAKIKKIKYATIKKERFKVQTWLMKVENIS